MKPFTITLAAAIALGLPAAAGAKAPETERWSEDYTHSVDCGDFVMEFTGTEHISLTTRFDASGEPVKVTLRIRTSEIDTNTETGKSLPLRGSVTNQFDLVRGTRTIAGAIWMGTEPGAGTYVHDSGRVVWDLESDDVLSATGVHAALGDGVDPLVCAALA